MTQVLKDPVPSYVLIWIGGLIISGTPNVKIPLAGCFEHGHPWIDDTQVLGSK